MKKFEPLLLEEIASLRMTHEVTFTADDLTTAALNTAQAILLPKLPAGFILNKGYARLIVPFEDKSDAALNTTTFKLGDAGDDDRYIVSAELNKNAAEITIPAFDNTAYEFAVDTQLIATFGSMAAKALANIDAGELQLVLDIIDTRLLAALRGTTTIVK